MRAVIYARYSSELQSEHPEPPDEKTDRFLLALEEAKRSDAHFLEARGAVFQMIWAVARRQRAWGP